MSKEEGQDVEEKFISAKDKADCEEKGGTWKDGKCIVETKEEADIGELIEKIKSFDEELKEADEDRESLHELFEEVLANLEEDEVEEEEMPSFAEWLKHLYELMRDEADRKEKYPYYPYYPYPKYGKYPKYPVRADAQEGEEPEEEEDMEGESAVTESVDPIREKREKVVEALREFPTSGKQELRETWTAKVVQDTSKEITGHLRDFMNIAKELGDNPGDTVDVAYVNDFDMSGFGAYGSVTLNDPGDIWGSSSFSVKEAGAEFDVPYSAIEKLDANLMGKLEEKFSTAALRAEDKKILSEFTDTSTYTNIQVLDKTGGSSEMDADYVVEAIGQFESNGIDMEPGDLAMVLTPVQHEALLKDVAGSMGLSFARPDVVETGRLTEFMGVDIRIVPKSKMGDDGANKYAVFFVKGKGHIFAPKRDLLLESWKDVRNRKIWLVGTHALAIGVLNEEAIVLVKSSESA